MPIIGALAAALTLLGAKADHVDVATGRPTGPSSEQRIAARPARQPIPGGAYVAGLVDAISPPASPFANGPHHDGMSLRELRSSDLSGQTTLPLLAGRF